MVFPSSPGGVFNTISAPTVVPVDTNAVMGWEVVEVGPSYPTHRLPTTGTQSQILRIIVYCCV